MSSKLASLLDQPRPLVMGILNVTPDSFSDGGSYDDHQTALNHALTMLEQGADIIDIGGESTRPGADHVAKETELERVMPVLESLRALTDACISVDTSTPVVMKQAASAGCDLINDVRSLTRADALSVAASTSLPVCLMHMQGEPKTMQENPCYENLIDEICAFFTERITVCEEAGIDRQRLILDPGFGFGKTPEHNLMLINRLGQLDTFELPILVGLSRKSTISKIAGSDESLKAGSIAGALLAVTSGAKIVRVHDVKETVAALKIATSIQREQPQ